MSQKIKLLFSSLISQNKPDYENILHKTFNLFFFDKENIILKNLAKSDISSKELTKLLNLLEDKNNIYIRKLSLLILSYLISNSRFKIYLMEKCGLSINNSRVFLTRLKYLQASFNNQQKCINLIKILKKKDFNFTHTNNDMFWYIPLFKNDSENFENVPIFNFNLKNININDPDPFENVPDPKRNLCGFIISDKDRLEQTGKFDIDSILLREKKNRKRIKLKINKKSISIRKEDKLKKNNMDKSVQDTRNMTSKSINRRINDFSLKNKLKMNKKFAAKEKKNTNSKTKKAFFKNYVSLRQKARVRTPTITNIYKNNNIGFSPIRTSFRNTDAFLPKFVTKVNKKNRSPLPLLIK